MNGEEKTKLINKIYDQIEMLSNESYDLDMRITNLKNRIDELKAKE